MKTFALLEPKGDDLYDADVIATVEDDATANRLIAKIRLAASGPRRNEVEVVGLDAPAYSWRAMRTRGAAKLLKLGMRFENAMAASRHMGYANNQVAHRLAKARRAGRDTATICGVTWKRVRDDHAVTAEPQRVLDHAGENDQGVASPGGMP